MKRFFAVFKREYLQSVRKKTFLVMTVLAPFLMGGIVLLPALLATRGFGDRRVAVVDGTGRLEAAFAERDAGKAERPKRGDPFGKETPELGALNAEYVAAGGKDPVQVAAPWLEKIREPKKGEPKLDGLLVVPAGVFDEPPKPMTYYSRSATDLLAQQRLARIVGRAISRQRLTQRGIDPEEVTRLLTDVDVEGIQVTRTGEQKKGGKSNFLVGFVFVAMLFLPALLYGQEILRGIIQEKSDRIVEILVSSMRPIELLTGKVLGMAAVGLTQLAAWVAMAALLMGMTDVGAATSELNLGQLLRPGVAVSFLVFYLLGYLVYVCVYAFGGAIVNSEKEAQNFLTPILLVLMIPWFLVMPVILNPDSPMAVALSFVPVFTPITMFIRILVSQPPAWQVVLSILLSAATIFGMFWVTAKVFRVGILSYGKRPTVPELWRWLKEA